MNNDPLAYFITFTCYGTWLHGRAPGSIDAKHNAPGTPFLPADDAQESRMRNALRDPPYVLGVERRKVVLQTICEVAQHRGWKLLAAHVRTTHVHVVVVAAARPEKVMSDFKAYASRRLKERCGEPADRKRWTEHGSTRYLWREDQLAETIKYVLDEQGDVMEVYSPSSEPEALAREGEG